MEADVAAARKAGRDRRRRRKAKAKAKAMAHFRQRSKPQQSREKSRSPSRSRSPGTKKKSRKRSRELRLMHELLRKYQSDLDFCAIGKCLNVLEGVPSEELLGEDLDLAAQAYIAVGELNHALEVLAVLILNFPQYEKLDRAILRAACLLKLKGRLEESESYFTYLQEIPPEPLPEHAILYQLAFVAKMKGKEKSTGSREGQRESKVKGSTSIAGAAFREARVRERQYEAMEVARRKRREVEEQDEGRKKQGEQRKQKASLPTAATPAILSPKLSMLSPKETRATQKPKRRPAPMAVTMRDYTFWEARAVEMFRAGFFVCAAELFQQGIRLVVSSNSTSSASKESDNQHEGAALRCRVIPMLAGLCVCFLRTGERDEARDAASSALVSAEIIKALGNAELARRCQERVAHVFGVYEQRSREQTNEWEWTFPTHGANLYSHVGRVDGTRLIAIDSVIDVLLELLRLADCACLGTALHRGQREREQQRDNDEKESSSSIDQQKVNFTEVHSLLHMTKGHFQRSVAAQQLQEAERKRQRRKKARALALRCARSMAERSTRYVFETWVKTARLSRALAQFGGRLNRKLSRNVFQSWNSFRCGARCARTLMLIRRSRLRKAISLMKLRSFLLPPLNAALNRLQERKFFRALREHRDSENARRLGATMTIQRAAWRWAFNGALVRAACRLRKRGPSCRPRPRCLWEECRAFCLAAIAGDDVAAAVIANASEGGILNNELRGTIDEVTKRVEIENESMQTVIQRAIARADAHARVDALAGAFLSGTGTDADSFAPMPGALRPSAKVGGILFLANAHKEQCCRLRAIPFQALYRGFSFRLLRSRAAAMIARVWRSFVRRRMLRWAVLEASGRAQKSAAKIQAAFRLFSFRLERWRAVVFAQSFVRQVKLRWLMKIHRASIRIQALFRGYAQRLRFRVLAFEAFRKALLESEFRSLGISVGSEPVFRRRKGRERSKNPKTKQRRQLQAVRGQNRSLPRSAALISAPHCSSSSPSSFAEKPLAEFLDDVRAKGRSASAFAYGGGGGDGGLVLPYAARQSTSAGAETGFYAGGNGNDVAEGIHAKYVLPPVTKVTKVRKSKLRKSAKTAKQRAVEREWKEFQRQLKFHELRS